MILDSLPSMLLTKEEASKQLWMKAEKVQKLLKDLYANPMSTSLNKDAWMHMRNAMIGLEGMELLKEGAFYRFYRYRSDENEYAIVRLEGFFEDRDRSPLSVCLRVLAATKKKIGYEDMADLIAYSTDDHDLRERFDQINPNSLDLPSLVGSEFTGTLLEEMLKKG